jgi:expansin (peptidoglycan-binding protein)
VTLKRSNGKQVTARVITTGETVGPNDIDLSQRAFEALGGDDYPRKMTWAVVKCPTTGVGSASTDKIKYQFQTEANPDWTSLWVRGARLPLRRVEVRKGSKSSWVSLQRGTDGTLTDPSGFGTGKFELRLTAYDGQIVTDSFDKFTAGAVLSSEHQFE